MQDEVRLPVDPSASRSARRWWRQHQGRLAEDVNDVVELLLTEVVTNAVVHARTPSTLRVDVADGAVCLELEDGSLHPPRRPRGGSAHDEHGRGVLLLDRLSTRWGVRRVPGGKVVWFCVGA